MGLKPASASKASGGIVKLNRRTALAGAALLPFAGSARAEDFPTKPIKIVVPFAAGSATDLVARGLGAKLQEILKQPIVVDDKPGASGQLGASAVAIGVLIGARIARKPA